MDRQSYQKRPVTPFFPERKLFGWDIQRDIKAPCEAKKGKFLKMIACALNKESHYRQRQSRIS